MTQELETLALDMFESSVIIDCHRAADQNGFDGGWTATDGERVAWGETMEEAQRSFNALTLPTAKILPTQAKTCQA